MVLMTLCTRCTKELSCEFFCCTETFILKSFRKIVKYILNSYPLSNTTSIGYGYLSIHALLNSWINLVDYLSMY